MYCVKKVTEDLTWVGANDRRLSMFEGVYSVPNGVSYNSYLLLDEKTVLFDTVDKSVSEQFMENVEHVLSGRRLDYVVIQHMEPDHSATLAELLRRCPETTVVCNKMIADMIKQFFNLDITPRALIVKEGDTLSTGRHNLTFIAAPMVHWPEVMVTYDTVDKILFSADAFGTFGALNGAIFADEVDFDRDYMDEARRYYTNIVGKYGAQVQALLKKAAALDIEKICPLHGPVLNENLGYYIGLYNTWSSYGVESEGVCIAYTSVYGNTEKAAELLAERLKALGCPKVAMNNLALGDPAEAVEDAFRYGKLVLASPTYNGDVFPFMKHFIDALCERNYQNRTIGLIENGSWAPIAAKKMRAAFEKSKNITFTDTIVTVTSALNDDSREKIDALAKEIL